MSRALAALLVTSPPSRVRTLWARILKNSLAAMVVTSLAIFIFPRNARAIAEMESVEDGPPAAITKKKSASKQILKRDEPLSTDPVAAPTPPGAIGLAKTAELNRFHPPIDRSRLLQYLIFYPHAGEFLFFPQFSMALDETGQTVDTNGVLTRTSDGDTYELTLAFTYGLSDRLRIGLSESDLLEQTTQTLNASGTPTTQTNSQGFSNPTLSVTYRWYEDIDRSNWSSDVVFALAPSFGSRKPALSTQAGNNLTGATIATLSAPVIWSVASNEIETTLAFSRNFGTTSVGPKAQNSSISTSYWSASFAALDRYHVTQSLYLQFGATFNVPYSYQTTSEAPGAVATSHTVQPNIMPAVSVGYKIATGFVLSTSLTYNDKINSTEPAAGAATDSLASRTEATVQARILF